MITFLVVGRNDGYGINLHKRTAISLNYFGSLCKKQDDEIIYVDCNTPEHDLTLAEAISDTLTPEAKEHLRIFRITGEQMLNAIGPTSLAFSDELARNVGIRRSNPKNKWILSTNCDILIFPLSKDTLQDLLSELPSKFYLCPRQNLKPAQWQLLNRSNVTQITEYCQAAIRSGLGPPVERPEPWLRYSSVGDFQLAPREQWLAINGCEEGMKLWGHSDANNAKRLSLLNGEGRTPDLGSHLCVLHLDHNVVRTNAHEVTLAHNDWNYWVDSITSPQSRNTSDWGLARLEIDEIRLPVDTAKGAELTKLNPTTKGFYTRIKNRTAAIFWRKAGKWGQWLERKLS